MPGLVEQTKASVHWSVQHMYNMCVRGRQAWCSVGRSCQLKDKLDTKAAFDSFPSNR